MTIEELKQDSEELTKLLSQSTRTRVKDVLIKAKAEIDREIVNLEMKARQAEERKKAGEDITQKRFLSELTEYAWDQSDKFVKLFITLEGVQNIPEENVTTIFTESSMNLLVNNMNGKDYGLTVNNLLAAIDVEKSYRKVKTGMVAIYMKKKKEGFNWSHLTTIQKRLKDKETNALQNDADSASPENALVNIMKKMYNEGDSKTKQMIAKAWTESQEKSRMGGGGPDIGGMAGLGDL